MRPKTKRAQEEAYALYHPHGYVYADLPREHQPEPARLSPRPWCVAARCFVDHCMVCCHALGLPEPERFVGQHDCYERHQFILRSAPIEPGVACPACGAALHKRPKDGYYDYLSYDTYYECLNMHTVFTPRDLEWLRKRATAPRQPSLWTEVSA